MWLALKILAVALVLALAAMATLWWRITHEPAGQRLEDLVDAEMRRLRLSGGEDYAIVISVLKDGRVLTRGSGRISPDDAAAPDGATVFQIGSITKVFTASLLQLLSQDPGWRERVFPGRTIAQVLGPAVPLAGGAAGITLEQLATHSAGLPRLPGFLERDLPARLDEEAVLEDPYSHIHLDTVLAYLQAAQENKPPGGFEYSNYGMGLLAHLLERATGERYEAMLGREILGPLGMHDTGIHETASMQARLAQGWTDKGRAQAPWRFQSLEGAGALFSTADDMMKFARANLEDGLPPRAGLQATHAPRASGKTGLGWMQPTLIDRLLGNRGLVWHDGGTAGYASYLSVDRQARTAVVILCARGMPVTLPGMVFSRKLRRFHDDTQEENRP